MKYVQSDTQDYCKEFDLIGAVVVRGVLSKREVQSIRLYLDQTFEELDGFASGEIVKTLPPSICWQSSTILQAALNSKIVGVLKCILEPNYSIIPDLEVHRNLFALEQKYSPSKLFGLVGPGWHYDAGAEGAQPYLLDSNYCMCKCGLYLQDNTEEWGGGIEIIPGSHRFPIKTGNAKIDCTARKFFQSCMTPLRKQFVKLNAGDFVAFHSCLSHRGSIPRAIARQTNVEKSNGFVRVPKEYTKYVIYYNAARVKSALSYMEHSLNRRSETGELFPIREGKRINMFFSDFPGMSCPEDFHSEAQNLIESYGLNVAKLLPDDFKRAKSIRNEVVLSEQVLNYYASFPNENIVF